MSNRGPGALSQPPELVEVAPIGYGDVLVDANGTVIIVTHDQAHSSHWAFKVSGPFLRRIACYEGSTVRTPVQRIGRYDPTSGRPVPDDTRFDEVPRVVARRF